MSEGSDCADKESVSFILEKRGGLGTVDGEGTLLLPTLNTGEHKRDDVVNIIRRSIAAITDA